MLNAKLSSSIDALWNDMSPLLLGGAPGHPMETPNLFVTISDDDRSLLRVDVYRNPRPECFAFQDVIVWNNRVFVGYGESVYVIDPVIRMGWQIFLAGSAGYFGAFYTGPGYHPVASGESLLRLTDDGRVLWSAHDLGLDGVVVDSVKDGVIRGEGEWDPPGGWKPFELLLDSGQRIPAGSSPDSVAPAVEIPANPYELQKAEEIVIQTEVDKALEKFNASDHYRKLLWTESPFSIASAVAIDFPDVERVLIQYLDGNAVNLIPFVKNWKRRQTNPLT